MLYFFLAIITTLRLNVHAQHTLPPKEEIPTLCTDIGELNVKNHLGEIYSMAKTQWTSEQLVQFKIKIDTHDLGTDAWILSMSADQKFRQAALITQLYIMKTLYEKYSQSLNDYKDLLQWKNIFTKALTTQIHSQPNITLLQNAFIQLKKNSPYDKKLKTIKFGAPVLCKNISCLFGVWDVVNFTHPKVTSYHQNFFAVSFAKQLFEILAGPTYQKGLALNSLKILHHIEQLQNNPDYDFSYQHFYTDLLDSFLEAGFSSEDANNKTMDILGLYGSRGASIQFLENFTNEDNLNISLMLHFNFVAISYLDNYKKKYGNHLYSLPKEITTTCDFGKPYHFWMSAYLTHKLKRKNIPKSSLRGAHLVGNLYEAVNDMTFGRRRDLLVPFRDPIYSISNNSIRAGISYRDLGGLWAINRQPLNLDDAFYSLLKATKKLSPKKINRLLRRPSYNRIYKAWKKMFNSDQLLHKWYK